MERQIIVTRDGSPSVGIPSRNITYHSIHGAMGESMHVFIRAGWDYRVLQPYSQPLEILEMGLGTGLNAWLTRLAAEREDVRVRYTALELYPLEVSEALQLEYTAVADKKQQFLELHMAPWEKDISLHPSFTFHKSKTDLHVFEGIGRMYDLVYYDAFAPSAQPELWTAEVFSRIYRVMNPGAILVTYCSKSIVRKAMQESGLTVRKIPGPWGKREMLRATRETV